MGRLEELSGCAIDHDLSKTTLNNSQLCLIAKKTQYFIYNIKSLIKSSAPDTLHKAVVQKTINRNQTPK